MFSAHDHHFMQEALIEAEKAKAHGEVPVGAVLVYDNNIIARAFNQPISLNDPTAHAEILVLQSAAKMLNNYRLLDTTLYVTLEPCPMCAGALVHARVRKLIYGTEDLRTGAVKSVFQIAQHPKLNHRLICEGGLSEEQCATLLQHFFKQQR